MPGRILHLLSQRPSRTGSGVTLDAVVRLAGRAGWQQHAVVGVPVYEAEPVLGELEPGAISPLFFDDGSPGGISPDLPYPVVGMSDVMPYISSVWSTLTEDQLADYCRTWRAHLERVIKAFAPDLIHTNHIWLMSSLVKDLAPETPVVAACHATGLRQMELCPGLKDEVVAGCRKIDRFCVLRHDHREQLAAALDISTERITVTGAGYRQELFFPAPAAQPAKDHLLYIGKFSAAKGLPWLLDAVEQLVIARPGLRLHVAGSGAGSEADALRERMAGLAPLVTMHGQLDQTDLAGLMRQCSVCVLPSFYEGVPLVLVEAAACGCRIVSTALPGVMEQIVPHLPGYLDLVPLPRMKGIDTPVPDDLPRFTRELASVLDKTLERPWKGPGVDLTHFTWDAVFGRVEKIWREFTA